MVTEADFRAAAGRVRNWGRWGGDDELGTWNLVGPEEVRASAAEIAGGRVFPLGSPLDEQGVWGGSSYRRNPIHLMSVDGGDGAALLERLGEWHFSHSLATSSWGRGLMRFNDDYVVMPLQAASQWDALSHCSYDGAMYNGVPATAVTSAGATRLGIEVVARRGVAARGVLVDLPRHRGLDHLPPGEVVEPEVLDAALAAQGSALRPGDVLLVRTGWWLARPGRSGAEWRATGPGLSWRCGEWLHDRGLAAVAADNLTVEVVELGPDGPEVVLPLHLLCLVEMGMMLGELWWLEDLAADCAASGTFACHLSAAPLEVTGGVGSPVNPVAVR